MMPIIKNPLFSGFSRSGKLVKTYQRPFQGIMGIFGAGFKLQAIRIIPLRHIFSALIYLRDHNVTTNSDSEERV